VRRYRRLHAELVELTSNPAPGPERHLEQIIVANQYSNATKTLQRVKIGKVQGELTITQQFEWADGRRFFDTSTAHIRKIKDTSTTPHTALQKWRERANWAPDMKQVWKETWFPFRSAKENCFFWQVLYQIPATNKWRNPTLSC
jgi:hypothetical protein